MTLLLCRILPLRPQQQRRIFGAFVVMTFAWTTLWIVSFHQSNLSLTYNDNHHHHPNEDYLFLPPISSSSLSSSLLSSSSSSLMIWNLFDRVNFGSVNLNLPVAVTTDTTTTPRYMTDHFCSGCRHAIADPNHPESERCGYYIQEQYLRQKQWRATTTTSATTTNPDDDDNTTGIIFSIIGDMIAQRFPNGCSKCQGRQPLPTTSNHQNTSSQQYPPDRLSCTMDQYRYWRYDSVAPVIRASSAPDQWFPTSKPKRHHFPAVTNNTTMMTASETTTAFYYGTQIPMLPHATTTTSAAEYYMEYNPSIVILPKNQYPLLQLHNNTRHDYYVISFRISNQNYCFHPSNRPAKIMPLPPPWTSTASHAKIPYSVVNHDYLGIVIVNATMSPFPGERRRNDKDNDDIVVYDTIVDLKAVPGFHHAQDFRLFVLQEQLYITSFDSMAPIWLTNNNNAPPQSRKDTILVPTAFPPTTLDRPAPFPLQVWIRQSVSCVRCHRKRALCGKNFNYFVDAQGMVRVEVWPTGPHTVHTMDVNPPCQRGLEPNSKYIGRMPERRPTFSTMEEVDFPALGRKESILTRGRGSACCITLRHPTIRNRTVLVGIQHSKTPSQRNKILPPNVTSNHYLSSFYAFESHPPYNLMAQSGWFCLGFSKNPLLLHRITAWRKLVLGGRTYDCPRIHFVSGMTIKVNDPDSVILAYGINDCYSRFVEIRLSDISDLLFIGPTV